MLQIVNLGGEDCSFLLLFTHMSLGCYYMVLHLKILDKVKIQITSTFSYVENYIQRHSDIMRSII